MIGASASRLLLITGSVAALSLSLPPSLGESGRPVVGQLTQPYSKSNKERHAYAENRTGVSQFAGEGRQERSTRLKYALSLPQSLLPSRGTSKTKAGQDTSVSFAVVSSLLAHNESLDVPQTHATHVKKDEPSEVPAVKTPVVGAANRIVVPSVGIDIAVQAGTYDIASQSWRVDDSSAFYAETTVPVNDSNGTTLIYGHARWGIFGTLPDIRSGAEASVYTAEGTRFVYVFESIKQVDPSDVSMLTVQGAPKLILQTCSGFFDRYRTLATFQLKEVAQS